MEQEAKDDILRDYPDEEKLCFPYLQLHEFEALLFVDFGETCYNLFRVSVRHT